MRSIKLITLSAIILIIIIILHTIWVCNLYSIFNRHIQEQINSITIDATFHELRTRLDTQDYYNQEYLLNPKKTISLPMIAEKFESEAKIKGFEVDFIVNLINIKTGEVINTTRDMNANKLRKAKSSIAVPLNVDSTHGIEVIWTVSHKTFFKEMGLILILSSLQFILLVYISIYLLKSYLKEKKIRNSHADFSNALIHNTYTPLQTIMQINSMLHNEEYIKEKEKRIKAIDIAQQQIVNLQSLYNLILTVAHSEDSLVQPKLELLNINDIIEQQIDIFKISSKKEVIFNTMFEPKDITFSADRTMIENAISNLIDNSIKYSGNSVNINIECMLSNEGLHLNIKDNGYGISESEQRTIFSKFERGSAVTRNEEKGFGIGLTYVKSVVESHRGTVKIFSNKKNGTIFTIFLPFQDIKNEFEKNII